MLSTSQPVGLPPPVSPFRPNLVGLELDVSDDEDGLNVGAEMDKILSNGAHPPPSMDGSWAPSASASPVALGVADLGTPQKSLADDDESPARPSPRPRATTLAQSVNVAPTPSAQPALPPLNTNRQFLRAASQPANILSVSPIQHEDGLGPLKSTTKRLVSGSTKLVPSRPEVTPLTTRKPLLSASAGKFLSRGGNGRISPPRRVLVKDRERDEEGETEDEDRAQPKAYPIAPRTSERNSLLRPRKEGSEL